MRVHKLRVCVCVFVKEVVINVIEPVGCVCVCVCAVSLFPALPDEQMRLSRQRDETQICK